MRGVAILTVLLFGCATSRPPPASPSVPLAGAPPARVALAEPELELWIEGTGRPDPAESQRSLERGRAALASALSGRGMEDVEEPDALLVVRSRAVTRTAERRSAQVWSAVGIVTVVAAVVAVIVLSRQHHRPQRAGVLAAPARGAGPVRSFRPHPHRAAPASFFWGWSIGVHVAVPVSPAPPPPPGIERVPEPDPLLDARGWFDADEVELTAELVDPASGAVRWRRALREPADPLDAAAMTRLVDRALAEVPFGRRGAVAPPPRERPAAAPEPPAEARPPAGAEGVDL